MTKMKTARDMQQVLTRKKWGSMCLISYMSFLVISTRKQQNSKYKEKDEYGQKKLYVLLLLLDDDINQKKRKEIRSIHSSMHLQWRKTTSKDSKQHGYISKLGNTYVYISICIVTGTLDNGSSDYAKSTTPFCIFPA